MKRELQTAIQKLAGTFKVDQVSLMQGTVKSVDEDKATCVVTISGDVDLVDVKLQSTICDGVLILPAVNSDVTVTLSKYLDPFVSLFGDVDKIIMQVGDSAFVITNDGKIKLNDGTFGGLLMLKDTNNPNIGVLKKLNNVENLLNTVISTYNTHTHPVAGVVANATTNTVAQTITPTVESDIANKDITHGKPIQ